MTPDGSAAFRLDPLLSQFVPGPLARVLAAPLELLLSLRRVARTYAQITPARTPVEFAARALDLLAVRCEVRGTPEAIPTAGSVVVIANHPFGGIEGLYLYTLLAARRPDVRVLGNDLLGRLPEFAPVVVGVDVLAGRAAAAANGAALRRAIRWVRDGGALLVFPAGEVSVLDPATRSVVDPAWHPSIARLIRLAHAPVVPVHVDGSNSPLFHAAGLVHPRLRTALLPRELFNKRQRVVPVRVGPLLPAATLAAVDADGALTEQLRVQVYALACGGCPPETARRRASARPGRIVPVADAVHPARLVAEVTALPADQRLACSGDLEVWHAHSEQVPWVMQEIGRVRELTFRAVGEGTHRARDIDRYDSYYRQLFVWNARTHQVVGGYRLAAARPIIERCGVRGLYTSTLFDFRKPLLPTLGRALELGRSFVRPEYQRSFAPLMLLWKGIAAYLVAHPEYRALFGPVSISSDYSPASRALLTGYLRAQHADRARAKRVRGREALPESDALRLLRREAAALGALPALDAVVRSIEPDGKGVPVLLRQYLKLGAKVLGFNLDRSFAEAIDVLVVVDLDETDERVLVRYMGREGADRFRAARRPWRADPGRGAERAAERLVVASTAGTLIDQS
jgi:putative hemolysin